MKKALFSLSLVVLTVLLFSQPSNAGGKALEVIQYPPFRDIGFIVKLAPDTSEKQKKAAMNDMAYEEVVDQNGTKSHPDFENEYVRISFETDVSSPSWEQFYGTKSKTIKAMSRLFNYTGTFAIADSLVTITHVKVPARTMLTIESPRGYHVVGDRDEGQNICDVRVDECDLFDLGMANGTAEVYAPFEGEVTTVGFYNYNPTCWGNEENVGAACAYTDWHVVVITSE